MKSLPYRIIVVHSPVAAGALLCRRHAMPSVGMSASNLHIDDTRNHMVFTTRSTPLALLATAFAILAFSGSTLHAAGDPDSVYVAMWSRIDLDLAKQLPRSALAAVDSVYQRASQEGNPAQRARAATYRAVLLMDLTDTSRADVSLGELQRERDLAPQPWRSVLDATIGAFLTSRDIFRGGRYRSQRTRVQRGMSSIDEWDPRTRYDSASYYYLRSLDAFDTLRTMPAAMLGAYLLRKDSSDAIRPTVYDILAHAALPVLSSSSFGQFVPDLDAAFAAAATFRSITFPYSDSSDAVLRTLRIYQHLVGLHIDAGNHDALIAVDVERLRYAYEKCLVMDRDSAYAAALTTLANQYPESPATAITLEALANALHLNSLNSLAIIYAHAVLARFPRSPEAEMCAGLIAGITQRQVTITTQSTAPVMQPALASIAYRNCESLTFRIYRISAQEWYLWDRNGTANRDEAAAHLSQTPLTSWRIPLPHETDFHQHRFDAAIPPLPAGAYEVIVTPDSMGAADTLMGSAAAILCTDLAVVRSTNHSSVSVTRAFDAESGAPLSKVDGLLVQFNPQDHWAMTTIDDCSVNDEGEIHCGALSTDRFYAIQLARGSDTLITPIEYSHATQAPSARRTLFFTDRAIYRPGQTIHFSGIMIDGDPAAPQYHCLRNEPTTITLRNATGREVATRAVTTNAFGSFAGSFAAPAGLLGTCTISNDWGQRRVRVEEYKRPTFEVTLDMPDSAQLGRDVTVRGHARTYTGAPVDGATVQFQVHRGPTFGWLMSRAGRNVLVKSGSLVTDANGDFAVTFRATSEAGVRGLVARYLFVIDADATDAGGETRHAETRMDIGAAPVRLALNVESGIDRATGGTITIDTWTGASGKKRAAASGTLDVFRLRAPGRIIRPRNLAMPDRFVMMHDAFIAQFPFDDPAREADTTTWSIDRNVVHNQWTTDTARPYTQSFNNVDAGIYRVVARMILAPGDTLSDTGYVKVWDRAAARPPCATPFEARLLTMKVHVGDTARIVIASSLDHANIAYELVRNDNTISRTSLQFSNEQRVIEIPVTEAHRGGFSVRVTLMNHHRFYGRAITVNVPWDNKEIAIRTATFRDHLRPGDNEEWKMIVEGPHAMHLAAEVAATMYDASLEAIYKLEWPGWTWPRFQSSRMEQCLSIDVRPGSAFGSGRGPFQFHPARTYNELLLPFEVLHNASSRDDERGVFDNALFPRPPSVLSSASPLSNQRDESTSEVEITRAGRRIEEPVSLGVPRTDFRDTAFFEPQMTVDDSNHITIHFTAPDALTKWRILCFAHTTDMMSGSWEGFAVTEKQLMVQPNAPRFLREGDTLLFPARIINRTDNALQGTATFHLLDPRTMQSRDADFENLSATHTFSVAANASTGAAWHIVVPSNITDAAYRIDIVSGDLADGEQTVLPVLPSRMRVIETLPLTIRAGESLRTTLTRLADNKSATLRSEQLTLSVTPNAAWTVMRALPGLLESNDRSADAIFRRYYAAEISSFILRSDPRIRNTVDRWRTQGALQSPLARNADLKTVALEETPWLHDAEDETTRAQRLGLLFSDSTLNATRADAMAKLQELQNPGEGGWSWFPGMPADPFITTQIVTGFARLSAAGIMATIDPATDVMVRRGLSFLDRTARIEHEYDVASHREEHLTREVVNYLYARSFFPAVQFPEKRDSTAYLALRDLAVREWTQLGLMEQAMLALVMHRAGIEPTTRAILASLRERALHTHDKGMFWKYHGGCWWNEAPIATQALMIDAFSEIAHDDAAVAEMQVWLIQEKRAESWTDGRATADACVAVLRHGNASMQYGGHLAVTVGGERIIPDSAEAGTGAWRHDWRGAQVTPRRGRIEIVNPDSTVAFASLFWRYSEDMSKITAAATVPLAMQRALFLKTDDARGPLLTPIDDTTTIPIGGHVVARIVLKCDRAMEYVHLQDMHGAGFEPLATLSRYRIQDGLWLYDEPRDASQNFYISRLNPGTYVLEYAMVAAQAGTFNAGISTVQSIYAPEYAAHSGGVKVSIR